REPAVTDAHAWTRIWMRVGADPVEVVRHLHRRFDAEGSEGTTNAVHDRAHVVLDVDRHAAAYRIGAPASRRVARPGHLSSRGLEVWTTPCARERIPTCRETLLARVGGVVVGQDRSSEPIAVPDNTEHRAAIQGIRDRESNRQIV